MQQRTKCDYYIPFSLNKYGYYTGMTSFPFNIPGYYTVWRHLRLTSLTLLCNFVHWQQLFHVLSIETLIKSTGLSLPFPFAPFPIVWCHWYWRFEFCFRLLGFLFIFFISVHRNSHKVVVFCFFIFVHRNSHKVVFCWSKDQSEEGWRYFQPMKLQDWSYFTDDL